MESVNLKLKFMDAVKVVIISSWLPFGLGIGLAAYRGSISFENIDFVFALLVGLITLASLIAYSIPYLSITQDGLSFKNWRGRDVFCGWDENLSVESKKYGAIPVYSFKQEGNNNTYKIPQVIFSYSEAKGFIKDHTPTNHKLRKLVS